MNLAYTLNTIIFIMLARDWPAVMMSLYADHLIPKLVM